MQYFTVQWQSAKSGHLKKLAKRRLADCLCFSLERRLVPSLTSGRDWTRHAQSHRASRVSQDAVFDVVFSDPWPDSKPLSLTK